MVALTDYNHTLSYSISPNSATKSQNLLTFCLNLHAFGGLQGCSCSLQKTLLAFKPGSELFYTQKNPADSLVLLC